MSNRVNKFFRFPKETARQIDVLAKHWGESLTQVVIRAIEQAYARAKLRRKK